MRRHAHARAWDDGQPRGSPQRCAAEDDGLSGSARPKALTGGKPWHHQSRRRLAMACLALLVSKKPRDSLCAYFVSFMSFLDSIIIITNLFKTVLTDFHHKDHKAHKELTKNVERSRLRRPRPGMRAATLAQAGPGPQARTRARAPGPDGVEEPLTRRPSSTPWWAAARQGLPIRARVGGHVLLLKASVIL